MPCVPTIVVAGFSGYGDIYLKHLLPAQEALGVRVVAVADPDPSRSRSLAEIRAAGIEVHSTLESLYARLRPDMAILATPVHEHARHITLALSHGSHVLCEKPLASSINDVHRLIEARRRARKVVTIGYQWSHCPAILALRRDVSAGLFGKPRRMRTLVLWPRDASYFTRNDWAGRVSDCAGRPILDSPIHNACAHFVHNALFVLGAGAYPTSVHAELYRAHDIESFDTAAVRTEVQTSSGDRVESLIVTSLAVERRVGPQFCYEFDDATVTYDDADPVEGIVAHFKDGRVKRYGRPNDSHDPGKLMHFLECARTNARPVCGIEESAAQVAVVCAAHEAVPHAHRIRASDLCESELIDCYKTMRTPHEACLSWATAGATVKVAPWQAAPKPELTLSRRPIRLAAARR